MPLPVAARLLAHAALLAGTIQPGPAVLPGLLVPPGLLDPPALPALPGPPALPALSVSPALPVSPGLASGTFGWPVRAPVVVRRFDPPPQPWLPGHRGVDLAASAGTQVYAAGAGAVSYAGELAGRGVVSVTHPGGLRTTYEPVNPTVVVGDVVSAGSELGTVQAGHLGCPAAACLHWGLRRADAYLDPLALLGLGRVRLLPQP